MDIEEIVGPRPIEGYDVEEIAGLVGDALEARGLDGLCNSDGCGCHLGDLMPCDDPGPDCTGGTVKFFGDEGCGGHGGFGACGGNCDFHIEER